MCVRDRNFPLYKKIDGAVIESESEADLDCVLTFQTDSILQRFMLRFESLALDCNDHLYIYDGAHAFGNYKVSGHFPHLSIVSKISNSIKLFRISRYFEYRGISSIKEGGVKKFWFYSITFSNETKLILSITISLVLERSPSISLSSFSPFFLILF